MTTVAPQISEYEPEIVRGEVVERAMPDTTHAQLSVQLVLRFGSAISSGALWLGTDLRVRTLAGNLRLVDVIAYRNQPTAILPENPPLATIEILSPGDRYDEVFEKCEEYAQWGVENIWVVEPRRRLLRAFVNGELLSQPELSLPAYGVQITVESLFARLPKIS